MNYPCHHTRSFLWLLSTATLLAGGCKPNSKQNPGPASNPPFSIKLVEHELLKALKSCPDVSQEKPLLAVRLAIVCPPSSDGQTILPIDKITLSDASNHHFPLNYLGGFSEPIDEFGLVGLRALHEPRSIIDRKQVNDVTEGCCNFIFFPASEGKAAFLLFEGNLGDIPTQTIHLGFDVAGGGGPFTLSLPGSTIVEIPRYSSRTAAIIQQLSAEEIKSVSNACQDLQQLNEKLWKLVGRPRTVLGLDTYEGTELSGTYNQFLVHGLLVDVAGDFAPAAILDSYRREESQLDSAGVLTIHRERNRKQETLNAVVAGIKKSRNVSIDRPEEIYDYFTTRSKKPGP